MRPRGDHHGWIVEARAEDRAMSSAADAEAYTVVVHADGWPIAAFS